MEEMRVSKQQATATLQKRAEAQRRIFDRFCEKHGVKRTKHGSWIVYKGTDNGYSPWAMLEIHYQDAVGKLLKAEDDSSRTERTKFDAVDIRGGICNVSAAERCTVGIHFCFTPKAALGWGEDVYELRIPPSAMVCIGFWARRADLDGERCKARASSVRVIRKLSEEEVN